MPIHAQALICDAQQHFAIRNITVPEPAPDQILIRTHFSGVSIGTEFALVRNKLNWGPYPLCTGYMGTGIIEQAGSAVIGLAAGDAVYFRANAAMHLDDGQRVSCVAGVHSSHAVIRPDTSHGAYALPPGVPMDVGSMFVMPAVGLNGVDMANPRMGDTVVVHGAGLIGLGVIAACAHRGCTVIAIDISDRQLALARELGADHTSNSAREPMHDTVKALAPDGADVVFEATGLPQCVDDAIALCRTHGKFVWQGNYGAAPISMHFLPPHGRRLQMFFPCDDGLQPCRRAVLKNIASGALRWDKTITHRVSHLDAPALFTQINTQREHGVLGAVVSWEAA
jgi:2-desacetyl-2-hydroxyethyl bacteriochlorophyllide A dehydrogenase